LSAPFSSARLVRGLLLALVVWSFLLRLGFAAYDLHRGRFFDERYSLENLQHLLAPGPEEAQGSSFWNRLRPANGWYPSLSYLPQVPVLAASQALHRLTGYDRFAVFEEGAPRSPTPTAYFLCRATVAVFGVLTLVLVFLAGRRLFGPERGPGIGLLAAVILAASPAHLRQSAMFKPDMLLTLCTLAAFLLTLRLLMPRQGLLEARRFVYRRWVAVGGAVGLATAAKLNGAFTALLPVLAAGWMLWPWGSVTGDQRFLHRLQVRRAVVGLLLAGGVSVAVYLALNPFVGLQAEYLDRNLRIYGERAELAELDRPAAFAEAARHLVSAGFHGRVLGWIALAGLVGLGARWLLSLRRSPSREKEYRSGSEPSPERLWGLVPLWVLGYGLLYTGTTAYPKPNNLLPLLPFTSLAAAWALVTAARAVWRFLVGRWPGLARPWGPERAARVWGAVLATVGVLVLWVPIHVYAYRVAVPSTRDLLERELTEALQPFAGRTVLFEGPLPEGMALPVLLTRRDAVAMRRLTETEDPSQTALADAVVSLARGALDPEEESREIHRIGPKLGQAWGPTWELRLHPWELRERKRHWAEEGVERWALPPPEPPDVGDEEVWLSVQILVRDPEPPPSPPRLEVGGQAIALHATRVETGGYVYGTAFTSVRFEWAVGDALVVGLPAGEEAARGPVVDVLVWGGGHRLSPREKTFRLRQG